MQNTEKIAQFFVNHYGFVLTVSFSYAPHPEDAKEIAQQVYVELLESEEEWLDEEEELKNHIRKLVRRVARRYWYEQKRRQSEAMIRLKNRLAAIASANETEHPFTDETLALKNCIHKLSDQSRGMIESYYFDHRPVPDLSHVYGKSTDAIYKALYRIREKLRDCIERQIRIEAKNV